MLRKGVTGLLTRYLGRLRYPQLFMVTAALFLVDLVVPDLVPFADEILLGLGTLLLGNLKDRQRHDKDPARQPTADPSDRSSEPTTSRRRGKRPPRD